MQFWRSRLFPFRASSTFDQSLFLYLHYPSTAYRLVTVPIFGSLPPALPSFPAHRTNSKNAYTHAGARAHTHTRVYSTRRVYDVGSRHRPYEFARNWEERDLSASEQMFETSCRGLASFYRALSSLFLCPFISLFYSSLLSFLPFLSSLPTLFIFFSFCANYYPRNNINRNNQVCEVIF